jgi:hypothetical protein
VEVAILTDGLVNVVGVDGTPIDENDYEVIGGLIPSRKFLGNLSISSDGLTLTRANGSDLGSFLDEGFLPGDLIRVAVDGVGTYDVEIASTTGAVTDAAITLAEALPVGFHGHVTTENTDTLSELTRSGKWEGAVAFDQPDPDGGWQIIREDASSWLADGFLEGQWVEICESDGMGNCTGMSGRFKIAIIRGTNDTKDEKIEFRSYFDLTETYHLVDDLSTFNAGEFLVRRIAPVATFSATDWYQMQAVDLESDVGYVLPLTRKGVKIFPAQTHVLSKLQGPLAVEGGVTGADRSLKLGLKLPGEADGPLFAIGPQPPESKQIDVLNIYNDGSQQDRTGTMSSTSIQGLGLAKDLDFGPTYSSGNPQTFGEPAVFPGGISFGSVHFVDGQF